MGERPDDAFILRVGLLQAFLGLGTIWLTWMLGRLIVGGSWALLPAAFIAISPHHVNFAPMLLTETVFTFVTVLTLLVARHAMSSRRTSLFIGVGALLVVGILVKPTLLYLPILLVAIVCLIPKLKKCRKQVGWLFLGWVIVMAPWWIRNAVMIEDPQGPSITIGTIHHGSYPDFRYKGIPDSQDYPYLVDPDADQVASDMGSLSRHIVNEFREQPLEMARWYFIGKPVAFFGWRLGQSTIDYIQYPVLSTPYGHKPDFVASAEVARILHPYVVLLGVLGLFACWLAPAARYVSTSGLVWMRASSVLMIYVVGVHMVGAPFGRYNVPFMPIIAIAGVFAVKITFDWLQKRSVRRMALT